MLLPNNSNSAQMKLIDSSQVNTSFTYVISLLKNVLIVTFILFEKFLGSMHAIIVLCELLYNSEDNTLNVFIV